MTYYPRVICECGAAMRVAYRRYNKAGQQTVRFKCQTCKAGRTVIQPEPEPIPAHLMAAVRPLLLAAEKALTQPTGRRVFQVRKQIATLLAHPALP